MPKNKPVPADPRSIAKELEKQLRASGTKPNKSGIRKVAKSISKRLSK